MMTRVTTGQDLCACYLIVQDGVHRQGVLLCGGFPVGAAPFNQLAIELSWKDASLAGMPSRMHTNTH